MRVSLTSILSVVLVCFIEAGWASHAENFDTEGNTTSPKGWALLDSSSSTQTGSPLTDTNEPKNGRRLLQAANCPLNFYTNVNYTIFTSRCNKTALEKTPCCTAFIALACPYQLLLNNESLSCGFDFFAALTSLGYNTGSLSNLCSSYFNTTTQSIPCASPPPADSPSSSPTPALAPGPPQAPISPGLALPPPSSPTSPPSPSPKDARCTHRLVALYFAGFFAAIPLLVL